MPENTLPVPFPLGGLNDNVGFVKQPPQTTRRAKNVRGVDPKTGRVRGAQRSGLSRFVSTQINAGNKIQDLASITYDQRTVDYADQTPTVEWEAVAPLTGVSRNGVVDRQGNVYALDGNSSIVKYNSAGKELFKITLPTEDTEHIVRALFVDDFDFIYAGVSEGGDQSLAAIWAFEPKLAESPSLLWTIKPGGYCEALGVRESKLYAALNYTDRGESVLAVYDKIDSVVPTTFWVQNTSHPLNDLATKTDGSVIITSEPINSDIRGKDPRYPDLTPKYRFWVPDAHLTKSEERVWSWFDAETIKSQFGFERIDDDDEVIRWEDRSGNGRHIFLSDQSGDTAPKYTSNAQAGLPGLRFNGADTGMMSGQNQTVDIETQDDQKSIWPTWGETGADHATFLWCFIFRADSDVGERGVIFSTDNGVGGTFDRRFIVNGDDTGAGAGEIYVVDEDGANADPPAGQFDNRNGVAIVTLLAAGDGGVITGGQTSSVYRVNGQPLDSYTGNENIGDKFSASATESRSWIGRARPGGAAEGSFHGYLMEAICLQAYTDSAGDVTVAEDSEIELIEGYLAWKYGVAHLLEDGAGGGAPPAFGTGGASSTATKHTYNSPEPDLGAPSFALNAPYPSTTPDVPNLTSSFGVIAKYGPTRGELLWAERSNGQGGVGYGVTVDDDGNVLTAGPNTPVGAAPTFTEDVTKWTDDGDGASLSWASSVSGGSYELENKNARITSDEFGNLHFPSFDPDAGGVTSYVMFDSSGSETINFSLTDDEQAYAIAIDPQIPDFTDNTPAITRPEFVYVFTRNESDPTIEVVHKLKLVSSTANSNAPRATRFLAVSGGALKKFTDTTVTTISASPFSASARFVSSATVFGERFYTDGVSDYQVYNAQKDTLTKYQPTSAGQVQPRARLIAPWKGALVFARFHDDPYNWLMTKRGDPYDVDLFPPVVTTEQAVLGNDSRTGPSPDIINTLIPYNDDLLVFGCDHSLQRMTGDPAAGGQFDLISDVTGVAFGNSWCKDDRGVVYFFGSTGGVFRWVPGQIPEELTEQTISRRLRDVDLGTFTPRLIWNDYDDGVHVFITPFGAGGTQVQHWFWERRTGAWWEDEFAVAGVQPTAVCVIDADAADDRTLLLGCEDSFVRRWDRDAVKDDQDSMSADVAIDSNVLIGPLAPKAPGYEMMYKRLTGVLANDQSGCRYRAYASDEADDENAFVRSGDFKPGRNNTKPARFRGSNGWIELFNAFPDERWAFETMTLEYEIGSEQRDRGG